MQRYTKSGWIHSWDLCALPSGDSSSARRTCRQSQRRAGRPRIVANLPFPNPQAKQNLKAISNLRAKGRAKYFGVVACLLSGQVSSETAFEERSQVCNISFKNLTVSGLNHRIEPLPDKGCLQPEWITTIQKAHGKKPRIFSTITQPCGAFFHSTAQ